MSFEKIGPYGLTAGDRIVASLIIAFMLGTRTRRIVTVISVLLGLGLIVWGLASGDLMLAGLVTLIMVYLFLLAPALRTRKGDIYLTYDREGLVADTADVRTMYKWATIGAFRKVGSRLFIMIGNRCALVVADRATSADNMQALMASLTDHRPIT